MGIVERAVEIAELEARAAQADQPPGSDEAATLASREPPRRAVPSPQHASPATEASSLTARDQMRIVQIDFTRLHEFGRLPPGASAHQTMEEMRRIKWPLLNAIAGHDGTDPVRNNVIQVTSALPGEGKSFTALNLALSIVRDRELQVILVDGDVARPGLTPALGLDDNPGLTDVLEELDRDVGSVTYRTDVEGLSVVPAGKWRDHASELLASSRMPWFIAELVRRVGNGVIIIDSPPLLATNEAQVVTRHVGQVLLVVRADDTEQRVVHDAIALIDSSASVSAVLNRVRASALGRYYGQYHYRYGSGYGGDARGPHRTERSGGQEE